MIAVSSSSVSSLADGFASREQCLADIRKWGILSLRMRGKIFAVKASQFH
jgi:hypothetical protein